MYCCCCLANISLPGIGGTVPEPKPFFYVNVADIESLEVEVSYVACEYGALPASRPAWPWPHSCRALSSPRVLLPDVGPPDPMYPGRVGLLSFSDSSRFSPPDLGVPGTTEKIFEEKRDLYDVYVDNQNVKTHHDHLQPLLRISSADREKYRRLNEQRCGAGALGAAEACTPAERSPQHCPPGAAVQHAAWETGREGSPAVKEPGTQRTVLATGWHVRVGWLLSDALWALKPQEESEQAFMEHPRCVGRGVENLLIHYHM